MLATPAVAQRQKPDSAQVAHTVRSDPRPNIIVILADDIGVEAFNTYGGEYYTPNIDALAREGMRFDQAYSTPLCSPSRTRLMTGLENHRNYEAFGYLGADQKTFGNVMKNAGYSTGIVGKWQLSGNGFDGRKGITPQQAGFDESALWQLKSGDAKGSRYWGPTRVTNGRTRISEEGFGPDVDLDFALNFIERHKAEPFFLYYPMVLVHNPFVPTPDSMMAEGSKARFSGMVSYMDREVGQIMARLKALGIDDNTVVLFTGDNGTNRQITSTRSGYQVTGGKGFPTANGTHVPMIVRAPGRIAPGSVSQALFDFSDVLPTMADLAERPITKGQLDGVSQWPVLSGKAPTVRDSIFMHYAPQWIFDPARLVFDAKWKLYGDGKFVSIDTISGVETEVTGSALKGEAAKRRATFQKILDTTKDGPLSREKFPMCAAQPSVDAKLTATEAGCPMISGIPIDA